jgi:hypothetical protein
MFGFCFRPLNPNRTPTCYIPFDSSHQALQYFKRAPGEIRPNFLRYGAGSKVTHRPGLRPTFFPQNFAQGPKIFFYLMSCTTYQGTCFCHWPSDFFIFSGFGRWGTGKNFVLWPEYGHNFSRTPQLDQAYSFPGCATKSCLNNVQVPKRPARPISSNPFYKRV